MPPVIEFGQIQLVESTPDEFNRLNSYLVNTMIIHPQTINNLKIITLFVTLFQSGSCLAFLCTKSAPLLPESVTCCTT